MDRPQTHWFYKRIKASAIEHQFYFELGGGLAFLLRRFHMIQPEYLRLPGIGTKLNPWQYSTNGYLPSNCQITSFATDGTRLYIGGNGTYGIWRSDDGGLSWKQKNNGGLLQSYALCYGNGILCDIGPAGIRQSTDHGETWQAVFNAPDASEARSIAYDGVWWYLGTTTGIFWSTTNPGSWTPAITPAGIFNGSIAIVGGGTLYAASFGGGIYKCTDGGENWTQVNTGLGSLDCQCISYSNGVLYCGTNTTGIYKSTDGGATWTAINTGITDLNVVSIDNSSALMAIAGTQTAGAFLTIDGGTTWTPQNTGLVDFALAGTTAITIGNRIFAGTMAGFFITDLLGLIKYPKIGVEFIDGTGAIRWQLQPIPADLYSAPRSDGVIIKTENAPYDNTGYGINMSAVFKPRSNTINLFYDIGELITCKLTGFQNLNPPGNYCPDYVDIAIEGVYIPNMPNPESVL